MIRKSDVQWWVLEAKKHPESAATIVEQLAERLIELDHENERLRDQLIRLQRRAPATANRAEVTTLQRRVKELQSRLGSTRSTESALIFLSERLQSACLPLSQARQMAEQGRPVLDQQALLAFKCLLLASPHQELLLLTNQGRGFKLLQLEIPALGQDETASEDGWPAVERTPETRPPASGERLAAAVAVGEPLRFWTVATRRGYVQRFVRVALDRGIERGMPLLKSPFRNDEPAAIVQGDRGDLLLITRWGKGVRFSQRVIEAQGSVALRLEPDDEVVAALALPSSGKARSAEILIWTASGRALRRDTAQFAARSQPGGAGRTLIQAQDVLAAFPYPAGDGGRKTSLLCLTFSGQLALFPLAEVPLQERAGRGTPLCDMRRDPAVAATLIPDRR